MAIRNFKPTTNARRKMSTLVNEEITTSTPEKSLLVSKSKTGGRNNSGKTTVRHIGGGAKQRNQYTFLVSEKASKTEIKEAIEKIFKVEVIGVSTLNIKTKDKRVGRYTGRTNRGKKAIVTLKDGMTIENI